MKLINPLNRQKVLWGVFTFIVLLLLCDTSSADVLNNDIWRIPEREGANALYLWLRLHDASVDYHEIVKLSDQFPRPLSLLDLKSAARQKGLNAVVQQGNTDDLIKGREPVVVYLEGVDGEHGFFALVLVVNTDDEIVLLNTSSAILTSMSGDSFRRIWTGHYLTVRPGHSFTPWLVSGISVAFILAVRNRHQWKKEG